MTSWETFSGLSGSGDLVFSLSGIVERVRIDVTDTGMANAIDQTGVNPRFFKLGWWTFSDNVHGLGLASLEPFYFIDFEAAWYAPTDGVNFFSGGFHGLHYNLFAGVVADFNIAET